MGNPTIYQEDYQMKMIRANDIEGILPVRGRGLDGESCYDYDVSGKISLMAMYERGKIGGADIRAFLTCLRQVLKETQTYLLDIHRLLLKPEDIFYADGQFYFCYFPPADQDFWKEFHELTAYFVKQADYEDPESVRIVTFLHKETMKENYSIEQLIETCLKKEKEEKPYTGSTLDELPEMVGSDSEAPQGESKAEPKDAVREPVWSPIRRLCSRNKKPKWGDWDGLHIEEEDLS